jgi:hypothetical protein
MTAHGVAMILGSLYQSMARAAGARLVTAAGGRKAFEFGSQTFTCAAARLSQPARPCLTQAIDGETRNGADPV